MDPFCSIDYLRATGQKQGQQELTNKIHNWAKGASYQKSVRQNYSDQDIKCLQKRLGFGSCPSKRNLYQHSKPPLSPKTGLCYSLVVNMHQNSKVVEIDYENLSSLPNFTSTTGGRTENNPYNTYQNNTFKNLRTFSKKQANIRFFTSV